jgi:AraC-like DNA-binding protein
MSLVYLTIFSSFITIFFSLVLLLKPSLLWRANRLLAISLLMMTLFNLLEGFRYVAHYHSTSQLLACYFPLSKVVLMLIGPSFYLYVRVLLGYNESARRWRTWLHALPALPSLVYLVWFSSLPAGERIVQLQADYASIGWVNRMLNTIFYLQAPGYLVAGARLILRRKRAPRQAKTTDNCLNTGWLRHFFGIALLLLAVAIVFCIRRKNDFTNTLCSMLVTDVLVLFLFFRSVWHTGLMMQQPNEPHRNTEHKLHLTKEQAEQYLLRLLATMDNERPYLNSTFSLPDLASYTGIPVHHLSYLLNNQLKKNFSDFINEYRIRHSCKLLNNGETERLTLEALGRMCGFRSYSSFSRSFRKFTGQSPHRYHIVFLRSS